MIVVRFARPHPSLENSTDIIYLFNDGFPKVSRGKLCNKVNLPLPLKIFLAPSPLININCFKTFYFQTICKSKRRGVAEEMKIMNCRRNIATGFLTARQICGENWSYYDVNSIQENISPSLRKLV